MFRSFWIFGIDTHLNEKGKYIKTFRNIEEWDENIWKVLLTIKNIKFVIWWGTA